MAKVSTHFADVNYKDAQFIIEAMKQVSRLSLQSFNLPWVNIYQGAHAGAFQFGGANNPWTVFRIEVLGHLNWLAEFMAKLFKDGRTFYDTVGFALVAVSAQDVLVHGAKPIAVEDLIATEQYSWGKKNPRRMEDFCRGFTEGLRAFGCVLTGGETSATRYIVRATPPVKEAPLFASVAIGIADPPSRFIKEQSPKDGDLILGARSTGIHYNGPSEPIREIALKKRKAFFDKLSDGTSFGEALFCYPACYLDLVMALQDAAVPINSMLAGSGGGVSKAVFGDQEITCEIARWPRPLPAFEKLLEYFTPYHFLKVFNGGIGWYVFVPKKYAARAIMVSRRTATPLMWLGEVKARKRGVHFRPRRGWWRKVVGPDGIWLDPQEV